MRQGLKLAIIPFLLTLFMVSSCDDPTGDQGGVSAVNITFKALIGGEPLIMNQDYMYNGKNMRISNLRFFVSDLALVKENLEVSVKDIDLVNFAETNIDLEGAETGISIRNQTIPTDTYDGIKFGIGVPSDLNAQSPIDFSQNHPLSGEYWSNWNSYIFHKIEGRYDDDNDPSDLEEGFVYHIGFDEYFRERAFGNLEIELREEDATEIVIEIELLDLLKDADGLPLVFSEIGDIHSEESNGDYTNLLASNWMNSFSL